MEDGDLVRGIDCALQGESVEDDGPATVRPVPAYGRQLREAPLDFAPKVIAVFFWVPEQGEQVSITVLQKKYPWCLVSW